MIDSLCGSWFPQSDECASHTEKYTSTSHYISRSISLSGRTINERLTRLLADYFIMHLDFI